MKEQCSGFFGNYTIMSLTFGDARHFLSRTGFGATPDDIRLLMRLDRGAAVSQALTVPTLKAQTPAPSWIDSLPPLPRERKHWSESARKAFWEARKAEGHELKVWWYRELLRTRSPL
ncbi:MAG: hypothetical protein ACXW36_10040, partial [Nitrospira sp.]